MRVKRIDVNGKRIVHGTDYLYSNSHPFVEPTKGTIFWDRDFLAHVFIPYVYPLPTIFVEFQIISQDDDVTVVQAKDYKRWKDAKR